MYTDDISRKDKARLNSFKLHFNNGEHIAYKTFKQFINVFFEIQIISRNFVSRDTFK